jgi:hypothetical protein
MLLKDLDKNTLVLIFNVENLYPVRVEVSFWCEKGYVTPLLLLLLRVP